MAATKAIATVVQGVRQRHEGNRIARLIVGTRPLIEGGNSTPNDKHDTANGSVGAQCFGTA